MSQQLIFFNVLSLCNMLKKRGQIEKKQLCDTVLHPHHVFAVTKKEPSYLEIFMRWINLYFSGTLKYNPGHKQRNCINHFYTEASSPIPP